MEYGLGHNVIIIIGMIVLSLNPCFNGIWSRTVRMGTFNRPRQPQVLILVLMEYGLGQRPARSRKG